MRLTWWLGFAGFGGGIWLFTLFKGYDWVTVLVVANLAFSGLLVSWVMKFADSILKVREPACFRIRLVVWCDLCHGVLSKSKLRRPDVQSPPKAL